MKQCPDKLGLGNWDFVFMAILIFAIPQLGVIGHAYHSLQITPQLAPENESLAQNFLPKVNCIFGQ